MRESFNRQPSGTPDGASAPHVTLNDCFVKAIALAARARTGKSVSIGIALGSANAPVVVADACTLPMPMQRQAIRDARAQADDTSAQHEGDHADVLVANFGAFGARHAEFPASKSYPIVLSIGAAFPTPVVRHGQIVVATVVHATVCVGEGVLDAATAGAMLAAFRGFVENPAAIFA